MDFFTPVFALWSVVAFGGIGLLKVMARRGEGES